MTIQSKWMYAPHNQAVVLGDDDVHIWRASLQPDAISLVRSQLALNVAELEKANRQYFDRDRVRSILARGYLRRILAKYLAMEACEIQFNYTEKGKPFVVGSQNPLGLTFNISHSANMFVCAVAKNRQVGIDVEQIREIRTLNGMIRIALSTKEQASFALLPKQDQLFAFFNSWTSKEAYLKAIGMGIAFGLQAVEVVFDPARAVELLRINGDRAQVAKWTIKRISPHSGYIAATVVEGRDLAFTHYHFEH
ncbi:MAG: 4'-phosphopantetheinyl transferase family protein [Phototrophicaceae bacterium]